MNEQIKVLLEKMKGLLLSDYADAVDDSIALLDQALTLLKEQPTKKLMAECPYCERLLKFPMPHGCRGGFRKNFHNLPWRAVVKWRDEQPCKVKCAAIKTKDGIIFEAKNHAICLQRMKQAKVSTGRDCEQGFVTTDGKFVDRHEAAQIAFEAGQTKKLESPLFSEDLTGDWPWKKDQPRQPEKKERD